MSWFCFTEKIGLKQDILGMARQHATELCAVGHNIANETCSTSLPTLPCRLRGTCLPPAVTASRVGRGHPMASEPSPNLIGKLLCDPMLLCFLIQQKTWGGGMGSLMGKEFSFAREKSSGNGWAHNSVNVINATELYT